MAEKYSIYQPYLDTLEILFSIDEKIADDYFYDFSSLVSTMDYLDFNTAYKRMKTNTRQASGPAYNRIIESAILLKLNSTWAEARSKYWVEHIQKRSELEAYCKIYRDLKKGRIDLYITPKNEQEALQRLQILLKVSIESADQYYEQYASRIISMDEYLILKKSEIQNKLLELAQDNLGLADRFYKDHAAELIPMHEYVQIKERIVQQKLRLFLKAGIDEADAFYNSYGKEYMSFESYCQIKKPILLNLLEKTCANSLKDADALFIDKAKGVVSQAEYDLIRKPVIMSHLKKLCDVDIRQADDFYQQEAVSLISNAEYEDIRKRPWTLAKIRELCNENMRAADCFFAEYAFEVITDQEYAQIKRPILLEQLKTTCERSVLKADALFRDCAADVVADQEYNQIKQRALLAMLQNCYLEDPISTDRFYQDHARSLISIEEYNRIRAPFVEDILKTKCAQSLTKAEAYYKSYAHTILSEMKYNMIRKPFLLSELRRMFADDYVGATKYYHTQLKQIFSEDEYRREAGEFVSAWFAAQKQAGRFSNSLPDHDQAEAIAMIYGNVLVTARAGSGKTATMINRAYFMIRHCRIPAEHILMLAFNRDAADEMRSRLNQLMKCDEGAEHSSMPHIMTFHALAYQLVLPEEAILYDDKNGAQAQSRLLQDKIIGEYLSECLRTRSFEMSVRRLLLDYFRVNIDDSEYLPRNDFLEIKRSAKQESLKGDRIKSYGEKRIANFLFEHDVKYSYERSFRWNGRPYRPDFTIPNNGILHKKGGLIIEYLGLQGETEYDAQTEDKRAFWKAHPEWQLVEMVPEDMKRTDAEFEVWFTGILRSHRIRWKKLTEDEIWDRARTHAINAFTTAMRTFIQRCRKLCISPSDLHERIQSFLDGKTEELQFANLAEKFYRSYLNRVKATGQDDFDGLMIRAVDMLRTGSTVFRGKNSYGDLREIRYIAIDEYQDFSELFYRLLATLRKINPDVHLYCVGDDWQAINGFAGSDLRFFMDFDRYFGQSMHIELLNNYRSNEQIVNAGNALMRGLGSPGRVAPSAHREEGKVYLCYIDDFSPTEQEKEKYGGDVISPIVRRLINIQQKRGHSVAILDRRSMISRDILPDDDDGSERTRELSALRVNMKKLFPEVELAASTVHSFKGLEKDAVIMLDVSDDCFPLIHPTWRFSRILGESIPEIVSEEQRLFYVALTRAKCELYLITEKRNASFFLDSICK